MQNSTLRSATIEDGLIASKFLGELGLKIPKTDDEIHLHWKRLWVENPVFSATSRNLSLGWVMEKKGEMIGFFGNLPRLYNFGHQKLVVSVASQWGIKKQHRTKIRHLANAYFTQKNTEILMATTANKAGGRIYQYFGGLKIPQHNYENVLFWIINPEHFVSAVLKKKHIPNFLSSTFAVMADQMLKTAHKLGLHKPNGQKKDVNLISIDEIDDNFDELWARRQAEALRLLACRDSLNLKWYFGKSPFQNSFQLLTCFDGHLRGYCALLEDTIPGIGLTRLKVVDMFVENDDNSIVNDLLCSAYTLGCKNGCDVLEWPGFQNNLIQTVLKYRPFKRTLQTWPLFYKPMTQRLRKDLLPAQNWHITHFDGDTTLAS